MQPKRGAAGSSSILAALPAVENSSKHVHGAVENWESGGEEDVTRLLDSLLASAELPLASLPISNTLLALLSSSLEPPALAALLSSVIGTADAATEERTLLLGEALMDVVEVMERSKDDTADSRKDEEMDVDGDAKWKGAAKGLDVIRTLLQSNVLPSYIPNLLLSPDLLRALSLLPPEAPTPAQLQSFQVKKNTDLFYRQSKYNLLREASEGFSGLIVLLTSADALPIHPDPLETDESCTARAKRVWDRIMRLIGYFNLSPPRVLDVILEIASGQVTLHWRFFLELLRCSPWGAAAVSREGKGKGRAVGGWDAEQVEGIEHLGKVDGDRVLSQVLGFKFGLYQQGKTEDTPMGLIYVAALLIKHGFVSLLDLLPFLTPDDSEMASIHKRYLAAANRSGPSNALANSVLLDEDEPTSSSLTNKNGDANGSSRTPKTPPDQRALLLQAFLSIGHVPPALFTLAKFPWLAHSHPVIADLILRIVDHAIEPVYAATRKEEEDMEMDAPTPGYTERIRAREVVYTLIAPVPPPSVDKQFEFFYSSWREELEVWSSVEDICSKGLRWLALIRGLGGRSSVVMVKICRIAARHFDNLQKEKEAELGFASASRTREEKAKLHPSEAEMEPWLDVLRLSLLPSLCVSNAMAPFDSEIWSLVKHFPYPTRYALYGEWRDSTSSFRGRNSCPSASSAAAASAREVKKALSRVTATSASAAAGAVDRGPARTLAKLSHTNPCALWSTAIVQVKAYVNIGQFIVEAGRYMSQLSVDVATFTLVDTLADDLVSRLNPTGTGVAQWLESLSTFVGDFNRRYTNMDLEPFLQFIINRLMRGESADLTILASLITVMTGVAPVFNFAVSQEQLQSYSAGKEMIKEAFYATHISIAPPADPDPTAKPKTAPIDKGKSTKKSLPRLINALRDTKLALPIWIGLAQTRQGSVDKMGNAPLKAIEIMQDSCHDVFIQYGDLLADQLSPEEHIATIPDLATLVSDFGLEYGMAFQILRPRLNAEVDKAKSLDKAAVHRRLVAEKEALSQKRVVITPADDVEVHSPSKKDDVVMEEEAEKVADVQNVPALRPSSRAKVWWPSALTDTMQQARSLLPSDVNDVLSAAFFVIFWHLSVSDISFSLESYTRSIERIRRLENVVAGWKQNTADNRTERARFKARIDQLEKERDAQQAMVNGPNRRRLRLESSKWFGKAIEERNQQKMLSVQLHQYCFYPRALLSPGDAVFVAKFIQTAHELGTIGFSTVFVYNNFFNDQLAACIFSCTESEARNLGRCLSAIMATLDSWHSDEAIYKKEALGLPDQPKEGVEDKPLPGMMFRPSKQSGMVLMDWQQFRNFYAKCHHGICKALVSCWTESDFMHTKNAITVGLQVIKYFPVMQTDGAQVLESVLALQAKDRDLTPDVKALATSYYTHLKNREKTRPLVEPSRFHSNGGPKIPTGPRASIPVAPPNGDVAMEEAVKDVVPAVEGAKEVDDEAKTTVTTPEVASRVMTPPLMTSTAPERVKSPPVGPRATRSTASSALSTPARPPSRTNGQTASSIGNGSVPTGPSRNASGLPTRPTATSMAPPQRSDLSVDEERAAARARKFGSLAQPDKAASTPPPEVQPKVVERPNSPTPAPVSRKPSPAPSTTKSVDSRAERKDRERGATTTVPVSDEHEARLKQEDLLKSRERRLRREKDKDKETPEERAERKAKERERDKERDRERDRRGTDDAHRRRGRDEHRDRDRGDERRGSRRGEKDDRREDRKPESRESRDDRKVDPRDDRRVDPRDDRKVDAKDERRADLKDDRKVDSKDDRKVDPTDDRKPEPRDDRRDERRIDAPYDRRNAQRDDGYRDRDRRPRDARDSRDTRDQRDLPGPRGPDRDMRSSNGERRGETTPKDTLRPERNIGPEGRIIDAPRTRPDGLLPARPADHSRHASRPPPQPQTYALPPRPRSPGGRSAPTSLAARMGPAVVAPSPKRATPPPVSQPKEVVPDRAPTPAPSTVDSKVNSDPRKRPLEDAGAPPKEESPGAAKRVKIDRNKARRVGDGGGNRLLAGAIKAAAPEKESPS
ncbi:THO complex subunit 2, partial [Tremellales sp. Uapishka_1]